MASLERHVPITQSTVFPLASITKAFTAMSILLAAEGRRLSLEDDVSTFVPGWAIREQRVTIAHLLAHTSGVRDAFTLLGWTPDNGGGDPDAIVNILSRQRGLNFAPGTQYQYNNGGYYLLGRILQRATGQSLSAFATANIFTPLQMTGAHFNGDERTIAANRASGYSPGASGWQIVKEDAGYGGNGGMIASVRDLLLWANEISEPRVVTRALVDRMSTPTTLANGDSTQSGMGMGVGSYRELRALRTAGGYLGAATELVIFPDHHAAISVLCNMDSVVMGGRATVNPTELTNAVADIVLEDLLVPDAASGQIAAASAPERGTASAELRAGMTGLYRVPDSDDHIVSIAARDGGLTLRDFYADDYDITMVPLGGNRFQIPGATLEFAMAEAGRPRAWHVIDGTGRRLFELPARELTTSAGDLQRYAGTYRSEELGVAYPVAVRDARLVIHTSTVHAVATDAFVGEYVGTVRFVRDAEGAISGFTLNRHAARGVRFDRRALR
jgi:CubicO group peptidase (beta-lactamase class C family)